MSPDDFAHESGTGLRAAHVPNATLDPMEVIRALVHPMSVHQAEAAAAEMLGARNAVIFQSARGALAAACATLAPGATIGLPAYTCAAVANAIRTAGGHPVYADVDELGLVPGSSWPACDLAITQDTYGFEAERPGIDLVIRDASHRADLLKDSPELVAITSFEHQKSLSAGQGGLAVTPDPRLAAQLREWRDARGRAKTTSARHAVLTLLILAGGRAEYRGSSWARPFHRRLEYRASDRIAGQSPQERAGLGIDPGLAGAPLGSVARLVVSQLKKLERVAGHRQRIVAFYDECAGVSRPAEPLLRYPLFAEDRQRVDSQLLAKGWTLGRPWFATPVHPIDPAAGDFGYLAGTAKRAEDLCEHVVNLPTHPLVSMQDARTLISAALEAGARPLASGRTEVV